MQLTRSQRAALAAAQANRAYMAKHGRTYAGDVLWTDREDSIVRELWPDRKAISKALPSRTAVAINGRAGKLGLRKKLHHWTSAEVARLRRLWPNASKRELLEAFPFANWTILQNQAAWQRKNGFPNLYRPKVRPMKTGNQVIDWIIEQAVTNNLSLSELDACARTGRYFQAGRHRYRQTWKYLARAVAFFEGELQVDEPASAAA